MPEGRILRSVHIIELGDPWWHSLSAASTASDLYTPTVSPKTVKWVIVTALSNQEHTFWCPEWTATKVDFTKTNVFNMTWWTSHSWDIVLKGSGSDSGFPLIKLCQSNRRNMTPLPPFWGAQNTFQERTSGVVLVSSNGLDAPYIRTRLGLCRLLDGRLGNFSCLWFGSCVLWNILTKGRLKPADRPDNVMYMFWFLASDCTVSGSRLVGWNRTRANF